MELRNLDYATLHGEVIQTLIALEKAATSGLGSLQTTNHEDPNQAAQQQRQYQDIFNDHGHVTLKTELLATLRILQDIRNIKVSAMVQTCLA